MALTDYKFVVVNGQNVKTFNETTHRWEQICLLSELTSDIITKKGFAYASLATSYSTILLPYTVSQTLDDGTVVYETEEITKSMGVTQFDEQTIGDTDYLVCTVPTFIPKDVMSSEDKLYAYSSTSGIYPAIISAEVNLPTPSHTDSILLNINTAYNYNGQIQYRFKVNNGDYTEWSEAYLPYNIGVGSVKQSMLAIGTNSITAQVRIAENDDSIQEITLTDCITISNNNPTVTILNDKSNSFKIEASIVDTDGDNISYRLLLSNDKYTNEVLTDWSEYSTGPINIKYYIDTTKVSVDKTNTIKIQTRDNITPDNIATTNYSFTGKYQNLVFVDQDGEYLTSDKGVILKVLNFGQVISGLDSPVQSVTLKNNNPTPITNLQLTKEYLSAVNNVEVQLSKTNNPFVPLESIDYGDEIIPIEGQKEFYVKISTKLDTQGTLLFDVNASADICTEE